MWHSAVCKRAGPDPGRESRLEETVRGAAAVDREGFVEAADVADVR